MNVLVNKWIALRIDSRQDANFVVVGDITLYRNSNIHYSQ